MALFRFKGGLATPGSDQLDKVADVDFSSVFGSASGNELGAAFDPLSVLRSRESSGCDALDESCEGFSGGSEYCSDGLSAWAGDGADAGEGGLFSVRWSTWLLGGVGLSPAEGRERAESSSSLSRDGGSASPSSSSISLP